MKHTLHKMLRLAVVFVVALCVATSLFAQQVPQTMNYQAVVRNAHNEPIANGPVSVRISILRGILSPTAVYTELHSGVTNANGLLSFEIGNGKSVLGVFSAIDWAKGPYSIHTETDNEGGDNYSIVGTSPILSVPYALRAQTAERVSMFDYNDLLNKPTKVSSFINDAGYVTREELGIGKAGEVTQAGVSSTSWSTSGNKLTDSDIHKFGTTDYEDVVFVTYDITRMRLTGAGDAKVTNNVTVGKTVEIGTDLTVKKNVYLNTVSGSTTNNGAFTVANASATLLSGKLTVDGTSWLNSTLDVDGGTTLNNTLDVDGGTTLNNTLDVDGATTLNSTLDVDYATTLNSTLDVDLGTTLNNTLDVDGATTLNSTLDVDFATTLNSTLDVDLGTTLNSTLDVDGATTLNSSLDVDGSTWLHGTLTLDGAMTMSSALEVSGAVLLNNTLEVDGATTLNSTLDVDGATSLNNTLVVTSNQANSVMTIENTNASNGDGLLIKLGRTHGAWSGSSYLQIANPATIIAGSALNTVKGWLNGTSFAVSDLWTIFPGAAIAGALVEITNTIIDEINDGLNLPLTIVPSVNVFPGYTLSLPDIPEIGIDIPDITIPSVTIGPYQLPAIPSIPQSGLPTIAIPNFTGTSVTNSLTRENHYVTFQDKDGRQTGAIKAESVSDWRDNTVLDDVYLTNLAASFIGIDLLGAAVAGFSEIIQLVDSYNNIGVAYESGNGDYAEWLEREDPREHIAAGDIVGVRGGKISKNITGAEQTMVVSHKPIVLGNMPEANVRPFGNDVAFMGQVPVKIMGPVATGDYIVATGTVKGYGIAVSAANMKTEDFTKVVGRSWENIPTQGPKMVNTVIGVHNGSWVKVVKKISDRQTNTDRRINALESKLQSVLGLELDNKTEAP